MSKKRSEDRLRSMVKNSSTHLFRNLSRIFKYGVIGFCRNIWLSITATIVTTLTLVLLFATVVAGSVLNSTADAMREKIDITIFFKPGTSITTLASMTNTMKKDSNVKTVVYSTSDEEYEKFLKETESDGDDDILAALSDDAMREIMLKSMQATMRIKVYDADNLNSIKEIVKTDEEFTKNLDTTKDPTYNTNDTAINTISSWANVATSGGTALCALFLIISILVIFNTIRMAIYSRSEEIYMEKLVGADTSFIRGPFLVEAMMSGVFAGIISSIIGLIVYNALGPKMKAYDISVEAVNSFLAEPRNIVLIFVALVATGIIITLLSSRLAIQKYLKRF